MRVTVEVPDEALDALRKGPASFALEMRVAAAVKWFEIGRLSQGRAAEVAGLSRSAFLDALGRFGVSPFQYGAEEILAATTTLTQGGSASGLPDQEDAAPRKPKRSRLKFPLLDEKEVAKILRCSHRTLQGWRLSGKGPPFVKIGRIIRYRRSDVEDFIVASVRKSTSDPGPGRPEDDGGG